MSVFAISEVVLFKVGAPLLGGMGEPLTLKQIEELLPAVKRRPNVVNAWIKDGELIARIKMDKKSRKKMSKLRKQLGVKNSLGRL